MLETVIIGEKFNGMGCLTFSYSDAGRRAIPPPRLYLQTSRPSFRFAMRGRGGFGAQAPP